jgi:hypothetical protein
VPVRALLQQPLQGRACLVKVQGPVALLSAGRGIETHAALARSQRNLGALTPKSAALRQQI